MSQHTNNSSLGTLYMRAYMRNYRKKGVKRVKVEAPSIVASGDVGESVYANRGNMLWAMPWDEYIRVRREWA